MGCGPGATGKSRSAGVFVVSIILLTRTPGSITRESMTPKTQSGDGCCNNPMGNEPSGGDWGDDPVPPHFQNSHQ